MLYALLSSSYWIILIILGKTPYYVTFFNILLISLSLSYIHIFSSALRFKHIQFILYLYDETKKYTFTNMFNNIILQQHVVVNPVQSQAIPSTVHSFTHLTGCESTTYI